MIPFTKMQAQGNDFVILNGLSNELPELSEDFIRAVTERRYGIGCDQLLVLHPSANREQSADAAMQIFNSDGSEAANCGNGLRCVGDLLIRELGKDAVTIALADRTVMARRTENGIAVEMGEAKVGEKTEAHVDIAIGNKHRVFFEATESFPEDINIEIITGQIADHVYLDIIERGAGRTPACGSGACAATAAIWHVEGHTRPQTIEMPGGEVTVSGSPDNLILEGSVETVFTGDFNI
ncbi:MAG: diaminopimelate epimerase [Mariprofundaceae bacterium]|nr:diaminopimelate epimerase [Mariprofundaceae bacterium]